MVGAAGCPTLDDPGYFHWYFVGTDAVALCPLACEIGAGDAGVQTSLIYEFLPRPCGCPGQGECH